jgi:hypothetical protein
MRILLAGLLILLFEMGNCALAQQVGTATIGSSTVGTVSSNIVGISWDKAMIMKSYCPLCAASTGTVASRMIGMVTGAGIHHLRILTNEATGAVTTYVATSPAHNTAENEFGDADLTNFANFVCAIPNLTFSWGINYLGNTSSAAAAEATEVNDLLGPSGSVCTNRLNGFEIGNEPDSTGYGTPSEYSTTASDFASGWNAFATAIQADVSSATFVGPSAGLTDSMTTFIPPFITANASLLGRITQHYYDGSSTYPTIASITESAVDSRVTTQGSYLESVSAANSNIPIEINEGSTFPNGGVAGYSNTYASALWAITNALDFSLTAAGAGPVTLDYSAGGSPIYANTYSSGYSPFIDSSAYTGPNPMALGIKLLSLIGSGNLKSCSVSLSDVNFRCYALVNCPITKVILVNQDATQSAQITITFPNNISSADSISMVGTSLTDTTESDITIQGGTFSNTGTLTLGAPTTETVSDSTQVTTLVPALTVKVLSVQ